MIQGSDHNNSIAKVNLNALQPFSGSPVKTKDNIANHKSHDSIKNIHFFEGFVAIDIDTFLTTDTELTLFDNNSYLHLIYVKQGIVYHKFSNQKKLVQLEELSPILVGSGPKDKNLIYLKNNRNLKLSILCIKKNLLLSTQVFKNAHENFKTRALFDALDKLNDYVYICSKDLKISEQFRKIKSLDKSNYFIDILNLKSEFQLVITMFLNQFYNELFESRNNSLLTLQELQKIRKLTEFILDNPDEQYTVKRLCRQTSLSPSKLQNGFKSMHGSTVSIFVRDARLKKAKRLFETSDYNVSEVVYMVGITSRSYFCKIFKAKYGVSPSLYRNRRLKSKPLSVLETQKFIC